MLGWEFHCLMWIIHETSKGKVSKESDWKLGQQLFIAAFGYVIWACNRIVNKRSN